MHEIDDLLKQLELIVGGSYPAADHNALPSSGAQRLGDHRGDVVAAVKADQARLDADGVFGEACDASLDSVGNRGGIPWSRDPIRIEAQDQYPEWEICGVHVATVVHQRSSGP